MQLRSKRNWTIKYDYQIWFIKIGIHLRFRIRYWSANTRGTIADFTYLVEVFMVLFAVTRWIRLVYSETVCMSWNRHMYFERIILP